MTLQLNGEIVTIPTAVTTIKEVIEHYKISNPVVIVEHNDRILEKNEHTTTEIADGDKIELIQFVGGG
ncbi:sulfur carrier protein ThiS [Virgibacillus sp. NKC19-3]|uniref:sulfur carrier protein ThiS n=1 Tax=Virgibacillus saliphilus TaxID=2831674 RepID=UPI001C9B5B36|nr:sulfur carrier protein ThiS [Virgibacillus sp. NKC19-3]MBY7143185.1 sulfur carrier protein ThiS [Virgibacillus sp. NKC19-3]